MHAHLLVGDHGRREGGGEPSNQCSIGAYEADDTPPEACTGDCDGNGVVAINELILGVNIVLGLECSDSPCAAELLLDLNSPRCATMR